ncbi:DNA internalization-related competence protein ComEC/Rec2 [Pseudoalteromonas pernae]|uniref:DNA internalization-related competence protein ComEC/Rec2 n=1 Tax=Pseudoalteromonas pernae TaxID=3118054 RepID=UPI0032427C5A
MILVIIRIKNGYFIGCLRFCALGIVYTIVYFYIFFHWNGPKIENYEHDVAAVVHKIRGTERQAFVTAKLQRVSGYNVPFHQTFLVSFSVPQESVLKVGDEIIFHARIRNKVWRVNYGVRDSRLYGFTQRLIFVASSPKSMHVLEGTKASVRVRYHQWLDEQLGNFALSGVYLALLSGDRSDIAPTQLTLFRNTGTIHLLAISGLHIALVFGLCFYMLKIMSYLLARIFMRRVNQHQHLNKTITAAALALCGLFVFLCDFPVSAQRAWLMLSVFTLLYLSHAQYSLLKSLLVAFTSVVLFNPFSLLDIGMWLSFCAVAAIFATLSLTKGRAVLTRYLIVQLSLFLILAPITLWAFGGMSLVSPFANVILVPTVSFVVLPLLLMNVIFGFPELLLILLGYVDVVLNGLFEFVAPFEHKIWMEQGQFPLWGVIGSYVSVFVSVYLRSVYPCVYAAVITVSYCSYNAVTQPIWRADILDVGHGLSVVISSNGKAIVYDLGASYFGQYSIVKNTLLPHIKSRELEVSHTIISHNDSDHKGGLGHWLEAGYGDTLVLFHPNDITQCKKQSLQWQGLHIRVLWPQDSQRSDNASSCVVYISDGSQSLLLTGDITIREEMRIVEQGVLERVDVVVSPHHGSQTSSSKEFIEAIHPRHVIHSSSHRYGWRMPHADVFARYEGVGATQWLTKHQGGVKVEFYTDRVTVQSAKQQKKYWFIAD